jgi:preprotein translocase subunit SecG
MYQLLLVIHVIIAIAIVGLVLIQQGKGAEIGAAFGSGASNTVFGSQGSGSFLFKLTGGLAMMFFATSLTLGYIVSTQYRSSHVVIPTAPVTQKKALDDVPVPVELEKDKK